MEIQCWVVWWNECVHESASVILSYHQTKAGAYRAARRHRLAFWAERDNMYRNSDATKRQPFTRARGRSCTHDHFWGTLLKIKPYTIKIED